MGISKSIVVLQKKYCKALQKKHVLEVRITIPVEFVKTVPYLPIKQKWASLIYRRGELSLR